MHFVLLIFRSLSTRSILTVTSFCVVLLCSCRPNESALNSGPSSSRVANVEAVLNTPDEMLWSPQPDSTATISLQRIGLVDEKLHSDTGLAFLLVDQEPLFHGQFQG